VIVEQADSNQPAKEHGTCRFHHHHNDLDHSLHITHFPDNSPKDAPLHPCHEEKCVLNAYSLILNSSAPLLELDNIAFLLPVSDTTCLSKNHCIRQNVLTNLQFFCPSGERRACIQVWLI
jgi:hypothetical protein